MKSDMDTESLDLLHQMHSGAFVARNLSAQAARELGLRILRGTYAPEAVLPDEGELAEELRVSRTVVREAVKILTAKGLVEARPRLGTRVMPRWNWQILDRDLLAWQHAATFSEARLLQLTEMRRVIEPAAANLGAQRRTPEDLSTLRRAFLDMGEGVAVPDDFVGADARFHSAVLKSAHNEYFDALEGVIYAGLVASIRITNPRPASNKSSLPLHQRVLEGIEHEDGDAASAAMRELLEDAGQRLSKAFASRPERVEVQAKQ
ncbi:MAG TPA: FadR/GntR family transcriptional regulator [Devosiaceae bacterium]|jgi:DNA-binding FadR family transcriptional regulator|nr:FadR/GntR family transcriptional regulator [Devosiaceae bacterium]